MNPETPDGAEERLSDEEALARAIATVDAERATWTRYDLARQLTLTLAVDADTDGPTLPAASTSYQCPRPPPPTKGRRRERHRSHLAAPRSAPRSTSRPTVQTVPAPNVAILPATPTETQIHPRRFV
jgi:hypothetical protein